MEDKSWEYSELPPESDRITQQERNRLSNPEAVFPPAERPVYAPSKPEPPAAEEHEGRGGDALSVTSLVIGIAAVILAAVFFYRSTVNIRTAEIRAQQALTAVDELKHAGSPTPAALKIELMRTTRTLDAMSVEYAAEPEALQKIEELRREVTDILAMLDEKAPEASAESAPPPAAGAANPAAEAPPAAQGAAQPGAGR